MSFTINKGQTIGLIGSSGEGKSTIVKEGDFVFIKKDCKHKITAIGDEMAIRLAVSRADVEHVYPKEL